MGCNEDSSLQVEGGSKKVTDKPKQFHDMSEEEKEEIKKEIEKQDKDIEEKIKNPKTSYENFDWNDLRKKLPVDKTKEERKRRLELCAN